MDLGMAGSSPAMTCELQRTWNPNPRTPRSHGIRILEFAGLGPAPYGGMLLADLGADVLLIERPGARGAFRGAQIRLSIAASAPSCSI